MDGATAWVPATRNVVQEGKSRIAGLSFRQGGAWVESPARLPVDTVETILDTVEFAIGIRPNRMQFTAASPSIGTKPWDWAVTQGLLAMTSGPTSAATRWLSEMRTFPKSRSKRSTVSPDSFRAIC
jgi:hypothetical protein